MACRPLKRRDLCCIHLLSWSTGPAGRSEFGLSILRSSTPTGLGRSPSRVRGCQILTTSQVTVHSTLLEREGEDVRPSEIREIKLVRFRTPQYQQAHPRRRWTAVERGSCELCSSRSQQPIPSPQGNSVRNLCVRGKQNANMQG